MGAKSKYEHLVQGKHKFPKAKNQHELHHRILGATAHEMAFMDEIVSHISGKREADEGLYPGIKEAMHKHVKMTKEVAAKLARHTHSKGSLARMHKNQIKAGDLGGAIVTGLKHVWNAAKKCFQYVFKGIKLTAHYGKKAAQAAAKWIIAHPGDAAKMVEAGVGIVKTVAESSDDPGELNVDPEDPRASKYKRMVESDSSSGGEDEDEKAGGTPYFQLGGLRPKRKYLF